MPTTAETNTEATLRRFVDATNSGDTKLNSQAVLEAL